MRHLPPDISDASFQIPDIQGNLLTDDLSCDLEVEYTAFDDSKLGDFDADPFTTPLSRSKHEAPLTLNEITPWRERKDRSRAVGASSSKEAESAEQAQAQFSVRPMPHKKQSVDDMFQRRKRDCYQQMGIDLTSKSTARLRRIPDEAEGEKGAHTEVVAKPNPPATEKVATKPPPMRSHMKDARIKSKRPAPVEHAGIQKHKTRVPSSTSVRPKSILKVPTTATSHPPSALSRTMAVLSQTPKAERPKWGDVVAEVQHASDEAENGDAGVGVIGGGLIDILVAYGEKLKGSLGYIVPRSDNARLSHTFSTSDDVSTIPANTVDAASVEDPSHITQTSTESPKHLPCNSADMSSKQLTLSNPTSSKLEDPQRVEPLRLSELSPSRQPLAPLDRYEKSDIEERPHVELSPMHPSKKREFTGSQRGESKKEKLNPNRPLEHLQSSKAASERVQPLAEVTSRRGVLGPSQVANGVYKNGKLQHGTQPPLMDSAASMKSHFASISNRDRKGKSTEVPVKNAQYKRTTDKEQHAPPLTIPSGPLFASDIYRQRALDKAQAEHENRERKKKQRPLKAGTMPYFHKPAPPARPAVRTTVPLAFTFQSDIRAAQRNFEFEEKRRTWESRSVRHALPMPDFAAIHATQAGATLARRTAPVLPTEAPTLTTMARAKERERFEEGRKSREQAAEKLREIRLKEKAEEEEKAYREARKKTIPKANEVPEWYKDVPKRKDVR